MPDPDCSALTADCSGRFVTALVPTVYLPQLYREGNRNLAGGMIRGDDVTLQAAGTITNTGYLLAGNTLSVTAREFLNQKRQADFGKEFQAIPGRLDRHHRRPAGFRRRRRRGRGSAS
ncbi:MAG: hypothetical protein MZW92_75475 [Comamonadaceae bacterium]|nr:hypothetical protein [Comamonadaceae bacterium]